MVLPEIEEEAEEINQRHSKLSLTSLLLGKGNQFTSLSFLSLICFRFEMLGFQKKLTLLPSLFVLYCSWQVSL